MKTIMNIISLIIQLALVIFLLITMSNIEVIWLKISFIPIVLGGFAIFGASLSKLFKQPDLEKIFFKCYIAIFLICWLVFLGIMEIKAFKQEFNLFLFIYTIPFWLAGIFALYKLIIKK